MAVKGKSGSTSGGKLGAIVSRAKQDAAKKRKEEKLAELRRKQQSRQATRAKQTMPKTRRAKTGHSASSKPKASSKAVDEELRSKLSMLEHQYGSLQRDSELGGIYDAIGDIEEQFAKLPSRLDKLRERGYVHSAHLENEIDTLDDQWDKVRPRVESNLKEQIDRLDDEMDELEKQYDRLAAAPSKSVFGKVETEVDRLEKRVRTISNNISELYQGIWEGLTDVDSAVRAAEWMIEQIDASPEIQLYEAEGPLLAVEAEWEQDGEDEGPDGVLYLTDQRLLFEQKEEIATKKFLFITREKEKVQKLLLDIPAREIQDVAHDEEGRGFLGMRKDDILELVFSANAPISRGRFHLKGQDSSDWAVMIKHVRSGEIDELRADAFVGEMEAAAALTASLPERCPNCFADVPPQPRGVTNYTCEFCDALIEAVASGSEN
ncbi:MAG: hypothetical protein KDI62_11290 [Anaerolineae bacterium]|nr:hypothetical protein [Anaerolineae bacterium]